ncbi:MAG: hypothetical protein GWO24_25920, partial [Akkermansiaceae bacterium]|nr:hypothetical protein [Akkermansiaceae bacterium]
MLTYRDAKIAGVNVADDTINNPPAPDQLITREELWKQGGLPQRPDVLSKEMHDQWQRHEQKFFDTWKTVVHKVIGRWAKTIRGEGFRLLAPGEVCAEMEDATIKKLMASLNRAEFVMSHVKDNDLTVNERHDKLDRQQRMAFIKKAIENSLNHKFNPSGGVPDPTPPTPAAPSPTPRYRFDPSKVR